MIADILPVPVLASPTEAHGLGHKLESEARESTPNQPPGSEVADSRGGQKNLSGGVESRHVQKADARQDERAADRQVRETETIPDAGLHSMDDGRRTNRSGSSAPPAQKIKQDAAYYRSYRARNKGRIQKQEEKRRERDRNKKWVVQTTTGLPDVGWKILSEFQVDVAMRAFWGKRKMAVPSATMGGILPSVADFNEEVTIMGVRTGESFYGVRTD